MIAAGERIRQAQAELRTTGVNAAADGSLTGSVTTSGGDGTNGTSTVESGTLGASLVIDLFGGIRREREAAVASLTAARAEEETVRLAWLAELIAAYSDARYYQEAMALTRTAIATREETVSITQSQFNAGAATEYEVAEARALLSTARADLPQFAALFDANVYAIATLLNEPAGPIKAQMQKGAPNSPVPGMRAPAYRRTCFATDPMCAAPKPIWPLPWPMWASPKPRFTRPCPCPERWAVRTPQMRGASGRNCPFQYLIRAS